MNSTGTKDIKKIQDEITAFLSAHGAAQVGFCKAADNEFKLGYAISYTVRLSNAVIDCIDNRTDTHILSSLPNRQRPDRPKLARMRLYARTIRIQICRHSRVTVGQRNAGNLFAQTCGGRFGSRHNRQKQPVFIKRIRSESKARNYTYRLSF